MGIYNNECHASHGLSERFTTLEVKREGKGTTFRPSVQGPQRAMSLLRLIDPQVVVQLGRLEEER